MRPGLAVLLPEVHMLTLWRAGVACDGEPGCYLHTLTIRPRAQLPEIPAEREHAGRTRGRAARITGGPAIALQTASLRALLSCFTGSASQEPLAGAVGAGPASASPPFIVLTSAVKNNKIKLALKQTK